MTRKPRKPKWLKIAERQQAAAEGEARTEAILDAWGKLPPVKVAPWYPIECKHGYDHCPICDGA